MLRTFALVLGALLAAAGAHAQAPAAPPAKNDYADPATWLCRPGRADACAENLDATVIAADGSMSLDRFKADPNPPIDCFYVYPTVSADPGGNATMAIEPAEIRVVAHQFARFAARCRLYAPMYRQVTLTALRGFVTGAPIPVDGELAYDDVADAWNYYLAHDNHGRGVVLIGHSQGSGVLTRLIAAEIDGKPVQKQLVSAILMGTSLQVPPGKDVGGAFKHIPLCRSAHEIGCAIAFASFRASAPPPAGSRFGQGEEGMVAACVNPAAPAGGSGELKAFLAAGISDVVTAASPQPPWTDPPLPITTRFVEAPGLLTGECVSNTHGSYLAVTLHPAPGGKRAGDIGGDVMIFGQIQPGWGLHLIDANLTIGNLLDVVGAQTATYLAKAPPHSP